MLRVGPADRRIAGLALPALGALAAEPLYTLVDTAIVGHLGVAPLAALALAGSLLSAAVVLCNFLQYGGTPLVGRLFASGDAAGAAQLGRQAVVLAIALGLVLSAVVIAAAGPLLALLGAHGQVAVLGGRYLRLAALGLPFALIALASQGYFRGVARLRLPFEVLLAGNVLNAALEVWFVYGLRWGITGSAAGTVIAQVAMAAALLALMGRRPAGAALVDRRALRSLLRIGGEIFIRTGSLYASFLLAGAVLARIGAASLAAHQVVFQLWNFLALALDALAIAAQVLVSHELAVGAGAGARSYGARTILWSVVVGVVLAAVLLALQPVLPHLFTADARVLDRVGVVWWIFALMQPLNALAFALDGILIGAGDTRFLALAMVPCSLLVFAPLTLLSLLEGWGIVGVWCALTAFILARALSCGGRFLGQRWVRVGAVA